MQGLLVSWQLVGREVLVVGSNKEAEQRTKAATLAGAKVTRIESVSSLSQLLTTDKTPFALVLACLPDFESSSVLFNYAKSLRIPINCADIPSLCNFFFVATHSAGNLQIAVSTAGSGPRLAARIKNILKQAIPKHAPAALLNIANIRSQIKQIDSNTHSTNPSDIHKSLQPTSKYRMQWLSSLCDEWTFEQMASISTEQVLSLLDAYKCGDPVPLPLVVSKNSSNDSIDDKSPRPSRNTSITPPPALKIFPQIMSQKSSRSLSIYDYIAHIPMLVFLMNCVYRVYRVVKRGCKWWYQRLFYDFFAMLYTFSYFRKPKVPTVYMVGSGPGSVNMLTLEAVSVIKNCDAIICDYLVCKDILSIVPFHVDVVFVGIDKKAADEAGVIAKCLDAIKDGARVVVRLKSGDSLIYARTHEEMLAFKQKDVAVEFVRGISSCFGVGNIPLTVPGIGESIYTCSAVNTGGAWPFIPLFHPTRTLVVLMPLKRLKGIVDRLFEAEYTPECKCIIVEKGGWKDERVFLCDLGHVCEVSAMQSISSPAVLVVGGVCGVAKSYGISE